MTTGDYKRKVTAILAADVKGYSRLMGEDEEATLQTLTAYRNAISDLVQQYRGRVVDALADSVLTDFSSVVDAVNCAVEIQREIAERNADLPDGRKMEFRIGVNLGDVIEEDNRIYGDGVNIASRVESLAEPGGICISGTVYDSTQKRLGLEYEFLGEQEVKNIAQPVRVYRVLSKPGAAAYRVSKAKSETQRKWQKISLILVVVLVIIVGAAAIWNFYLRETKPPIEVASLDRMAFPLPDAPSIAVLPFTNLSGDPGQDFLADGITENIITALSKAPRLFVIARNSTFTYKGKPVKVQQVAEDLGVRYVLEGSAQRSGDRIRVTVQLIDALSGGHLWAERYDRDLKDLFAFQDEIAMQILSEMQVKLTEGDQARWRGSLPPQKADTILKYWEALGLEWQLTKESNAIAKRMAEELIGEDPKSPLGYTIMAMTLYMDPWFGPISNPQETLDKSLEMAQKAYALGNRAGLLQGMISYIYGMKREFDKAVAEGELAVQIEPSGADGNTLYGLALMNTGRAEEAISHIEKGLRLNPYPPVWYYLFAGHARLFAGQYEKALIYYRKAKSMNPSSPMGHRTCAAAYALLGRQDEARAEAEKVMLLEPSFSLERFDKMAPFHPEFRAILISAFRKAGLK